MAITFFPNSEAMLLARAESVAGYSLAQLACYLNKTVPDNLLRHKGWIGGLIELFLGATAGNKAEPDFPHLGIELKTIPIDQQGNPLETTFVCVAPLLDNSGVTWETCYLKHKLHRVLWIPIESAASLTLGQRRIGRPILWSPNVQQEIALRNDWEELMEMIILGKIQQITAHHGEVLQIRPKAANSRAVTAGIGLQGEKILALPRGFYLRKHFTKEILQDYLR